LLHWIWCLSLHRCSVPHIWNESKPMNESMNQTGWAAVGWSATWDFDE
jgi:hypothetical protein